MASLLSGVPEQGAPPLHDPDATASVIRPPPADPDATTTVAPRAGSLGAGAPAFPVASWDRFEPIRFLGQGAMGKVFLARDVRLQREVAIKFVHGDDPGSLARLVMEARAQARVTHERVCKVFEVGEVLGEVYIAMQFIDGEPLSAVADGLSVEQKARLVRDAALGLHEAHRQGIVHRDVKPANIMVVRTEDGDLGALRDGLRGRAIAERGRHPDRHGAGDPALHGPRAGPWRGEPARPPGRRLQPGRHALRGAHGPAPHPRRQRARRDSEDRHRGAAGAARHRSRHPGRPRGHRRQVPGEGPRCPLRLGARAGRGSRIASSPASRWRPVRRGPGTGCASGSGSIGGR